MCVCVGGGNDRASEDLKSRGPEFDLHKGRRDVSLSKTHYLPTVLKHWLRPEMSEKLLTGTSNINTNKQIQDAGLYSTKVRL